MGIKSASKSKKIQDSPVCRVYFAASSEVMDEEKELFKLIISCIEHAGGKITSNWLEDQTRLSPEGVYQQATEGIKAADVLVAELSYPSTGVGQQISYAISARIPTVGLYKKGLPTPSRFTVGTESDLFQLEEYESTNLVQILRKHFKNLLKSKDVKFNFIATRDIDEYLENESQRLDISKSQFLRQIIKERMGAKDKLLQ